jgi:phage replication-related protein YjqB (UPF0714/DUF867 family)
LISSFIGSEYALADVFGCYQAPDSSSSCTGTLLPPLKTSKKCKLNEDYRINLQERKNKVVVLAIHGGNIEVKTSDIVRDLANATTRNWSFYDFNGNITNSDCRELASNTYAVLHITSTRFNEASAVELVQKHKNAIAIHGHGRNNETDNTQTICVGGANKIQVFKFIQYVKNNTPANLTSVLDYSLNTVDAPQATTGRCFNPTPLTGTESENIVNKNDNKSGRGGLQLELSKKIRDDLAADKQVLTDLIYGALDYAMLDSGFRGQVYQRKSDGSIGQNIAGVKITFTAENGTRVKSVTSTGASGFYSIELPPQRYVVTATHPDYDDYSTAPGFFVVTGKGFQTGNIFLTGGL